MADFMCKVVNMLVMLSLSKVVGIFKEKFDVVCNWLSDDIDLELDEFNKVVDVLLYVENSIVMFFLCRGLDSSIVFNIVEDVINDGILVI